MHSIPCRPVKSIFCPQIFLFATSITLLLLPSAVSADDWPFFFEAPNTTACPPKPAGPSTGPRQAPKLPGGPMSASARPVSRSLAIASSPWAAAKKRTKKSSAASMSTPAKPFGSSATPPNSTLDNSKAARPPHPPSTTASVYALGYLGDVHCLNLNDGHVVWHKHLVDDFGGRYSSWKYAGSPLVIDDLLIFDTGRRRQFHRCPRQENRRKGLGNRKRPRRLFDSHSLPACRRPRRPRLQGQSHGRLRSGRRPRTLANRMANQLRLQRLEPNRHRRQALHFHGLRWANALAAPCSSSVRRNRARSG